MARLKTPMKMRNRIFVFMILTAMPMATVWSTQAVSLPISAAFWLPTQLRQKVGRELALTHPN